MELGLWGAFIRTAVCLLIIIMLIYLSIKYGLSRTYSMRTGNLEVIERISLAPKVTLNIVKIGSEYLLLSATEQEIVLIKQLENYKEAEIAEPRFHLSDAIIKLGKGSNRNA